MKWLKNNLANFFTLGNLACGFLGITLVFTQFTVLPFWLLVLAAVLDFFDGFVARATKTTSKIGADLDSLADMVTFGVLPGIMVFEMLPVNLKVFSLLIPLCGAWRLAKFNNDTRGGDVFYGLPIPSNALVFGGVYAADVYWAGCLDGLSQFINFEQMHFWLIPLVIIMSILMVSDIQLLSNKISNFSISKYKWHLVILVLGIVFISLFGYLGISLTIISYVLISIIITFATAKNTKKVS